MPAKAPPSAPKIKTKLRQLGQEIRVRRKALKVSATGAAEAAGISRMTLNRIERGETSVTIGAYFNVMSVLGLEVTLEEATKSRRFVDLTLDSKIQLANYPELKKLAWQMKKTKELSPQEALNIYERNWRHIDLDNMKSQERDLLKKLLSLFGKERLLV